MAIMRIVFQIDTTKLPKQGGTFGNPTALSHPPLKYGYTGSPLQSASSGDFPVPVSRGDVVNIYCRDASDLGTVSLAPTRIIAMDFNNEQCSVAMMTGDNPPIGTPNFWDQNVSKPDFRFQGTATGWKDNTAPFAQYAAGGSNTGEDASFSPVSMYEPFITFQATQGRTGKFHYGIEFTCAVGQSVQGSYWFDPYIQIS